MPTFFGLLFRERLTELSVFASPMRDFGGGRWFLDFLSPFEQVAAAAVWAVPIWLFNTMLRSRTGRTIDPGLRCWRLLELCRPVQSLEGPWRQTHALRANMLLLLD